LRPGTSVRESCERYSFRLILDGLSGSLAKYSGYNTLQD
jgi:hypothetical protein